MTKILRTEPPTGSASACKVPAMQPRTRRALIAITLTAAAVATVATSPRRWHVTSVTVPFHAVLDPTHNATELVFTGTLQRPQGFNATVNYELRANYTAAVTNAAPGEHAVLRLMMNSSWRTAAGIPTDVGRDRPMPIVEPALAVLTTSPGAATPAEQYTLTFQRYGTFQSTVEINGTVQLEIEGIQDQPPGISVTLAPGR